MLRKYRDNTNHVQHNPSTVLSVFLVKIFSIFGSLSRTAYIAHAQPHPYAQASPAPMQIIDLVRAKVAAGGELGAKVACRVPLKIDQIAGK